MEAVVANPLDFVTEDERELPEGLRQLPRVFVRPENMSEGGNAAALQDNPLVRAVAPEPPTDIMAIIQLVKDRLLGTGGQERYQTWPERMIRSGATLPGDVMSGAEPMLPPGLRREDVTDIPTPRSIAGQGNIAPTSAFPSDRLYERAQDVAGLAGGSALIERPGAATLGSGPVRQFRRGANENLNPEAMSNAPEFYIKPNRDELFVAPVKKEYKSYPNLDDPNKVDIVEISHDAYSQVSKNVKTGLSPGAAKAQIEQFTAKRPPTSYVVAGGKNDPHIGQRFATEKEAKQFLRDNRKTVHDLYMRDPRTVGIGGRSFSGDDIHLTGFDTPEAAHGALAHLNSGGNYDLTNGFKILPGKNTTLRSDTQQPGAAIAAATSSKGPALVFYSALEHAATNAAQDVMSPQQWLGYLKNQPGVKQEELQWTGLPEWLAGQKGKVKKEDVQSYLDEHKVEIKDVTKANKTWDDLTSGERASVAEDHAEYHGLDEPLPANHPEVADHFVRILEEGGDANNTKYSSYQLPGGENYREHLLTLPVKTGDKNLEVRYADLMRESERRNLTVAEERELSGLMRRKDAGAKSSDDYHSSHWDEPNVLAHVRTNDRVVDGQKSLHIEEIQSDWHQQGRKHGYNKNPDETEIATAAQQSVDHRMGAGSWGRLNEDQRAPYLRDAQRQLQAAHSAIPDAPFKTSWPELALKRMIRHAAENGYDRISWTPGKEHNRRYPDRPDKEQMGMEYFYDKMLPKMAEKIGKAHGVKVKQTELPGKYSDVKITGRDGEFYLEGPSFARHTTDDAFRTRETAQKALDLLREKNNPVHYFDLPQSLRDHAIGKGFPLYMSGVPFPLTPVDHDPFKKEK